MNVRIAVIIAAAGSSSRMGGQKKEYRQLPARAKEPADKKPVTVLGAVVRAFAACPRIGRIVVAIPPGGESAARNALPPEFLADAELCANGEKIVFVEGGKNRQLSVYNALCRLEHFAPTHVLIHDGARPWISLELIERVINAAVLYRAAIPVLPLVETPKEGDFGPDGTGFISRHLKRVRTVTAQTPQGFSFPEILEAHRKAAACSAKGGGKIEFTDDAEIWGEFAGKVAAVPGDPENRKITFPSDLETIELFDNRPGCRTSPIYPGAK